MHARSLVALSALALGVACSSKEATTDTTPTLSVATTEFTVGPGAEVFMCTITDVVLSDSFDVVEVHGQQLTGGHHVALMYMTDADMAPGPTHACTDEEMTKLRFVGAGAEGSELKLTLPAGMAIKIPKGARLVLQSHYVNPTGAAKVVHDTLQAHGPANAKAITTYADAMTVLDSDFRIPAHGEQTRVVECPIEEPINVLNLFGHAHEWSTNVKIGVIRNGSTTVDPLYNEKGGKDLMFNPPTLDYSATGGMHLAKGDKLRLECSWKNTTDRTLEFPSEMCIAQMYYAPGRGFLVCGQVVSTKGDVVPVGGETGMTGCTAPPATGESCVRPCDLGNSRGVGKYCTKGGKQCDGNQSAIFCTADSDPTAPGFCTKPCSDDGACGLEASCTGDDRGKGCVPLVCQK